MRERTKNPLQALIAIEIIHNNNPLSKQYDTYHVHLHCIINGYTQSLSFVQRWLNGFPQATKAAQSIKQIYDIGKSLKEICKYITKLDINKATSIEAIDTIIQATKGRRLIEAYGIKKNRDNKLKKTAVNFKPLKAEVYIWQSYEWYSAYEPFSNFKPTKPLHNEILKIKEKQINSNKINTRGTPTINRISRSPKPKETFTDHKESYTEGSKELVFTHSLKSNTLTST
jgi:hypothetical protein